MPRYLAVSAGALCAALCCTVPATAHAKRHRFESLPQYEQCEKQKAQTDSSSEVCLEGLKVYVRRNPWEAFAAGKIVRRYHMHWVALEYFEQGLRRRASAAQCKDADVHAAVISGLALPSHYPAVAQAQALVRGHCNPQLTAVVAEELKDETGHVFANACPLLTDSESQSRCRAHAEALAHVQPAAPPPEQPTKEEMMGRAPALRESPPRRQEPAPSVNAQHLGAVFPSVPGSPSVASRSGVAELRLLDWRLLDVDDDSGELLRGTHGEELLMAHTTTKANDYVLLKFRGVTGPWNERVLLALETRGPEGTEYVVVQDGLESVVMIERQGQFQAFPRGVRGGVRMNMVRANAQQALKLPSRREIAGEFAAAQQ